MHLRVVALVMALVGSTAPPPAQAQPIELPARKPGQWDIRMVTEKPTAIPPMTMQMCIDAATDREMMDFGLKMSDGSCRRFDMKRAGTAYVIDAECTFGGMKSVTKATISGDFQSSVTIRIEGTADGVPGAGKGPQQTLITQTATWKAATCSGGMKPGDVIVAGGLKLNIKDMKKLEKMLPALRLQ
jgi:hypothetical protein